MRIKFWPSGHSTYFTAVFFYRNDKRAEEAVSQMKSSIREGPSDWDYISLQCERLGRKVFLSFSGPDNSSAEAYEVIKMVSGRSHILGSSDIQDLTVTFPVPEGTQDGVEQLLLHTNDLLILAELKRLNLHRNVIERVNDKMILNYTGPNVYNVSSKSFEIMVNGHLTDVNPEEASVKVNYDSE